MDATLTASQIATLCCINERPGRITVAAVGFDYAAALEASGYITIKKGKCSPTAKAAPFKGRSPAQVRASEIEARATLIARWGSL